MKVLVNFNGDVVLDVKHLPLLSEMTLVDREGYGKDARYLPIDRSPSIELIQDSQLITGEAETAAELRSRLSKAEQEKSDQWLKMYNAQEESKKLKERLAALEQLCPHPKTEVEAEKC